MLLPWIMHISAHDSHSMTDIRSCITEVDQSFHQTLILFLVHWITTFCTQLVVLFYRGGSHLAPHHSCFSEQVKHILSLRKADTFLCPRHLNAKEISYLSQILDLKLFSEFLLQ